MRYVVVSYRRGVAPYPHLHLSEQSARDEAERLARQNRDDKFAVWEVRRLAAVAYSDVRWTRLDDAPPPAPTDDSDIPF